MDVSPQTPRRTWKQRILTSAMWWWICLTWYALSIGPMYWTWHSAAMVEEPSFIEVFYRPLLYLCQIPIFGDLMNAYIELWVMSGVSNWQPPAAP
ncbi:MAG: hypothetical protein JWM11_5088 [Planctomycetaceae bacterium]|nr:hypothetical protein [Planctomycetaceae bacterium]